MVDSLVLPRVSPVKRVYPCRRGPGHRNERLLKRGCRSTEQGMGGVVGYKDSGSKLKENKIKVR